MQIQIYTTPTCHFCHMTKDFFKENNVEYTEFDVSVDQAKAQEMIDKSGQMGVPVIRIVKDDGAEEMIVGFQQDKLKEILGL